MAKAIRMNITPQAIHSASFGMSTPLSILNQDKFTDYYGNIIDVPTPEPGQAVRGFSDDPNYSFGQDPNIPMEQRAIRTEDITQMPGYIPKEEPAKTLEISVEDMARMTLAERSLALNKKMGERPTISGLTESLAVKAEQVFIKNMVSSGHYPDQSELADFRQKVRKEARILEETKMQLADYDKQRADMEKQAEHIQQEKKVKNARYKEGYADGKKKIDLLDPKQRAEVTRSFLKELNAAMTDPEDQEFKIAQALAGIPESAGKPERVISPDKARELQGKAAIALAHLEATGGLNEQVLSVMTELNPGRAAEMKGKTNIEDAKAILKRNIDYYGKLTGEETPMSAPTVKIGMSEMPDPVANKNKIIRDTVSGKRYKSNGTVWVETK